MYETVIKADLSIYVPKKESRLKYQSKISDWKQDFKISFQNFQLFLLDFCTFDDSLTWKTLDKNHHLIVVPNDKPHQTQIYL